MHEKTPGSNDKLKKTASGFFTTSTIFFRISADSPSGIRWQFTAHISPRTIHYEQFTAHNSSLAQLLAAQFTTKK
jgi:hypothetical protein